MNLKSPMVSVIMPNFNSGKFISESILSVINQTFSRLELIIIDDNSTDNSLQIIKKMKNNDKRIKLIKLNSNKGPGFARNEGLKVALGKYITFLDSDDLWKIDKLEIQIPIMERLSIPVTHTDYGYLNAKGEILSKIFKTSNYEIGFKDLLRRTEISCLTIVYNKELVGVNFFPEIKRKQDYVVWLNILKKGYKSVPLHFVSGYYRQQSTKKIIKRLSYINSHFILLKSDHVGLSVFQSLYYTTHYLLNGVSRYIRLIK